MDKYYVLLGRIPSGGVCHCVIGYKVILVAWSRLLIQG